MGWIMPWSRYWRFWALCCVSRIVA